MEITSHELEFEGRRAEVVMAIDVTERRRLDEQGIRHARQLEKAFMRTIEVVMNLSEMRDPYTVGHERQVAEIAVAIGAGLGMDAWRLEGLRAAGCVHDVGKIAVPSEILAKPSRLTPAEYELIKVHPRIGHDVLKGIDSPWPVAQVALQHHERLDGSGYPHGLANGEILLEARILAVADVVEAMAAHRPYRPGLGIESALAEIERGSGTLYDPQVAAECLSLFRTKGFSISS